MSGDTNTHRARPSKSALLRLRGALRRTAILEVITAGVGIAIAVLLAEGLIDYFLRFPAWLRALFLLAGLVALALGIKKRLIPALRLRPKLSTLALRVEESRIGADRKLGGVFASGAALGDEAPPEDEPRAIAWLRERAASTADERSTNAHLTSLIRKNTLYHNIAGLAMGVLVLGTLAFMMPSLARTGAERALMPWTDASWPRRTEVADVTRTEPHALGSALPLRAVVTRTNRELGRTPVEVVYRVLAPGVSDDFRTEPMTGQETIEILSDGSSGEAYERLIEPAIVLQNPEEPATLEYYFQTPDHRTETQSIALVEPPRVVRMTASVTPPTYAPTNDQASPWTEGAVSLGEGLDERAILGPVLAGSEVRVTIDLNKPASLDGQALSETQRAPQSLSAEQVGATHTLTWTAEDDGRLRLRFTDNMGIQSVDDAFVRLESLIDRDPSVTVTVPERDEAVLASAVVDLTGEARDDVGLEWIALRSQIARVPVSAEGSPGAIPEGVGEPETIARSDATGLRAEVVHTLDLGQLDLTVGDAVRITAAASDVFALPTDTGTRTHGETVSAVRTLQIISETELVEQILGELGGIRRTAVRLDEQQRTLIDQLRESRASGEAPPASMARDQAALTDALDRLSRTTDRLRERTDRNGLDNASLDDLLTRAEQTIDEAARDSEAAATDLSNAAEEEVADERTVEETRAEEAQQRVRRAMEDLALMLDRGEDTWAVRQALEGLRDDQAELQEQTEAIGARTVGKPSGELTQEELTELDRIAQRQLELAQRASDLLDELDDKSQEMQETDPGQAAAMRAASRRGRERGVPQSLQQASESVQSNNTTGAQRQQQEAMAQLDQMLDDLEEAEKQRDQELQRALLSMIESIEALVRTQEGEIARLRQTMDTGAEASALAPGMVTLHRNTLGVVDEASGKTETVRIAGLLSEAASAQTDAIVALKGAKAELALNHEQTSLDRLESALEEANEELDNAEERERERRREELKAAYTEALTRQVEITEATGPLVKDRLSRRERATAKDLGRNEQELRESLRQVAASYEEISSAGVFDFAHQRLDAQLNEIGTAFVAGNVRTKSVRQQASVESLLRGLIEALEDPEKEESPFAEGSSGGEGSTMQQNGQDELIPSLAELRLLRTMQQDLLDQTKMIESFGGEAEEARAIGQLQNEIAEQGEILIEKLKTQGAQQQGVPPEVPSELERPGSVDPVEPVAGSPDQASGNTEPEGGEQ